MNSYSDSTYVATASPVNAEQRKLVVVTHENCEVVVCLTEDGRFVGITELRVKKDFLTAGQRVASSGYLDVEEFYKD